MKHDPVVLESIERLVALPDWDRFKTAALKKLETHEDTVSRLVFRTRSPIDPVEIEYYRGFRQGVQYVLEGLPNTALAILARADAEEEIDSVDVRR